MSEIALNPEMFGEVESPAETEKKIVGSHKKWLDRLRFTIEASVLAGVVAISGVGITDGVQGMRKDLQAAEQAEQNNQPADQSQEAHDRNMRQLGEIAGGLMFGLVALGSVKNVKAPQ